MKSALIRISLVCTVAATLQACAPLMVGGMVGGAMVASDRRTSGMQLEDENILGLYYIYSLSLIHI